MKCSLYYLRLQDLTARQAVVLMIGTEYQVKPNPMNYDYISTTEVKNLQEIFLKYQNIDAPHGMVHSGPGLRSMMSGDVLIDYDNNKGYVCRPFGWLEFNPEVLGFTII